MQLSPRPGVVQRPVRMVHLADESRLVQDLADPLQLRFEDLTRGAADLAGPGPDRAQPPSAVLLEAKSEIGLAVAGLLPGLRRVKVEELILRTVRELALGASAEQVEVETPLMQAGIDSLAAAELSSRLRALTGATLSPTLVFEQPTARAISSHLLEQLTPQHSGAKPTGLSCQSARAETAVLRVVGGAGRWPGGIDCHFARPGWLLMQQAAGDAVGGVPLARWSLASLVDVSALSDTQLACVQHGGFVAAADQFDANAFGVSSAEASTMDPQQRLLLELGYAALHAASRRRAGLAGTECGVFLGMERPDWVVAQPPSVRASVYMVTADAASVAAGRLSFVLGLHGPCASIDAACASSMVAVDSAAGRVLHGECSDALAAGSSLKLVPHGTIGAARAGMLSVDGRCKSLDAAANGYARSEAVGALALDGAGERVPVAHLAGSAVRQDGRSASLTAPNGSAQRVLLLAALDRAALTPGEVSGVDLHGTGTALGDPTEAGALAAVHAPVAVVRAVPLAVGAAKANVGHSEAPSAQVPSI